MEVQATSKDVLLQVENLSLQFGLSGKPLIRDVSFSVAQGERVGIVGESGCGKTMTGLSLLGLQPPTARLSGAIKLGGQDLLRMSARDLRRVRGRDIAMIFQEPMSALDPVFTVGDQIIEALRAHFPMRPAEARARAIEALAQVGIPAPERRVDDYPHQLSGGMRQRVMIAMALVCKPKLVVADEPTTALDVTVQSQITDLLVEMCERSGAALLFITHDLGVVAETCTRVITMYAGEIVEDAPVDDMLMHPLHPYTSGLLRSLPGLAQRGQDLPFIPGRVPSIAAMPEGCRFHDRCPYAEPRCQARQHLRAAGPSRDVRCIRHQDLALLGAVA